ncbi:DUF1460 domain-containing protein [Erysipelothrix rhusiopathiae]|uniref:N-acetylmuramoyl-L-alanine amidase-like domain-containing protein n=1 Tax=Erysipelothrix rhusiopathiae TaxID=1648 RepID=UPI001EDD167A|nr:N-acetylmuramoyl-L-alanine amidase-like domain-containing protein [Erysipelothrix rhusiopathiae]MDE8054001.1 DUF1460 domain-containing protein [Erysipelothrix rhusiopathiae]MDE8055261.1 DUF1460 domain-containing protein [Erysipelothrix rhusiopathiae]MDE8092129.1 DUF1460 domain-containing protein [Erysipelothrix rhusiopathiae]MDE8098122.1 DUF1460 domain-containing protein [Erysipelothrix rhusiopathiae]MDE8106672.1 DUF1460 domain-containing protein [Erysipelothrix rhusiopathiae]
MKIGDNDSINGTFKENYERCFCFLKKNNSKTEPEKIDLMSTYFLDIPYVTNRLVGSPTEPEQLVIALRELDNFTFLDYIESFKRSQNEEEFTKNLEKGRYIDRFCYILLFLMS